MYLAMPRAMTRHLVVMLVATTTGCATIEARPPQGSDAPLRTAQAEVVRKDGAYGTLKQDGTTVTLVASRSCDVVERPTIVRTTRTEFENKSAVADWVLAGSGLVLAGVGAGILVDAHSVGATGTSGRTYNPVGPTGATVIGISGIALGVGLLAISIVDVVRANNVTVEKQEVTSNGATLKTDVACSNKRSTGAAVSGKVGETVFDLGKTNLAGKLTVDIDAAVDPTWVVPSPTKTMTILVGESEVATVDLGPLFTAREDRAWQAVAGAVPACASPTTSKACDPVWNFLSKYSAGRHSAEARKIVDDAAPKIRPLADDEMWRDRKDDVQACASKKFETPTDVDAACTAAEAYLSSFPDGQHFKEAAAALKTGHARSAALTLELERRQARAEALGRQAEAALQEAERRRQAAADAAERTRERQEAAQERTKCEAMCRMGCSSWQFRNNVAMCYSGCVQSRCSP